ncbi:3',5'-cyclic-nucleotide phosphodiesterase PDE1 NDAI_0I03270 [Naumovozyma dairenensis CBS 421]|uniref:3',5'-cyclic-nucleotide phosphodiesterase n=1 Tax=Naumovozyma dairenensis (strain ATCC 10597 / BCRC 20456 / CBS 421 / NBRC 0211 / NRRL Y-12639) TaxID=1071378 RepID=G0WGI4_NAUDC|nr:hypothetical protein NDAI_0I03270 [Naumovozyma dairenensis CBS 421]CCD26895.1 hypothetical protein NDAI_0I03270 [Naumovozyma dairenensis CBS 421]
MSPSFEVTILGASGGPLEGTTQCFMVRPTRLDTLASICVDAGVGLRQIIHTLLDSKGTLDAEAQIESFYENDFEPASSFVHPEAPYKLGFSESILHSLKKAMGESKENLNTMDVALQLFQNLKEYYVTHPHLDHTNALVINSPSIYDPRFPSNKTVYGLPFSVEGLKKHIFNDVSWPNLIEDGTGMLEVEALKSESSHDCKIFPQWNILPFKVSHGVGASDVLDHIYSTVYLLRDRKSNDCIVIGGDVERDPKTGNKIYLDKVWQYLASNIPPKNLKGIFIECSSPNSSDDEHLYGHMSPNHLIQELSRLRGLYNNPNCLDGLNIIITHTKMISSNIDPRFIILRQLRELAKVTFMEKVLFSIALPGFTVVL